MNPYENRENKDWRAISIEGKVPVVQVGSETPGINESLVTMEFINDLANSKLTGSDPVEKAKIRLAAIEFDKAVTNSWYGFLMGKCEKSAFVDGVKKFVGRLDGAKGQFFGGSATMTYVDMVVLPWLARNYVLYAWKQFNIENELDAGELTLYKRWIDAIRNEESVKASLPKDQEILVTVNFYGTYANGKDYQTKPDSEIAKMIQGYSC